ncbi:hypothetical protein MKW92_046390 [Papaver armeniacum]|nr:hypothetical protein MKW92_046390 [Papaver armeniacum]
MAKAIKILGLKKDLKIIPTFVTIDPERNSSQQLKAYLVQTSHNMYLLDPNWRL